MARRRAARIDANHTDIVVTLRGVGHSVQSLANVGQGVPDLLIGAPGLTLVGRFNVDAVRRLLEGIEDMVIHEGANLLAEVKDGAKVLSRQRLTDDETRWHQDWQGSVLIIRTENEAMHAVGVAAIGAQPGGET